MPNITRILRKEVDLMNQEGNLHKISINWYPRSHGKNQKRNFRRFKTN